MSSRQVSRFEMSSREVYSLWCHQGKYLGLCCHHGKCLGCDVIHARFVSLMSLCLVTGLWYHGKCFIKDVMISVWCYQLLGCNIILHHCLLLQEQSGSSVMSSLWYTAGLWHHQDRWLECDVIRTYVEPPILSSGWFMIGGVVGVWFNQDKLYSMVIFS